MASYENFFIRLTHKKLFYWPILRNVFSFCVSSASLVLFCRVITITICEDNYILAASAEEMALKSYDLLPFFHFTSLNYLLDFRQYFYGESRLADETREASVILMISTIIKLR